MNRSTPYFTEPQAGTSRGKLSRLESAVGSRGDNFFEMIGKYKPPALAEEFDNYPSFVGVHDRYLE